MSFPVLVSPVVQVTLLWLQITELRTMQPVLLLENPTSKPSCLAMSSSCLHFHSLTLSLSYTTQGILYRYN